jgi:hypothetical protein
LFFYEGQRLNLASADPSARGESEAITLHGYFDAFNFFFPNNSSDDFTQESQGPTYFKNIANSIVKYVFSVNCDQRFVRVRGLHGMRLEAHTCGFSLQVRAQMIFRVSYKVGKSPLALNILSLGTSSNEIPSMQEIGARVHPVYLISL